MSRYYKADDVIRAIEEMQNGYNGWSDTFDKAQIIGVLEELPTIDIVRCKDCKNVTYKTIPVRSQDVFYGCPYSEIQHDGDFYCAYGERKDNE